MARIVFSRSAREQVAAVEVRIAEAVLDAVTLLEGNPEASKPLRGRLTGLWALRIGSYRLVYEIRDRAKSVRIIAVLPRRIAYRSDPR